MEDISYIRLSSGDPSVLASSSPGDFTVQLGKTLTCMGDCDAYLLEAYIPFTWSNVDSNDKLVIIEGGTSKIVTLTTAYYSTIPILVAAINKELGKQELKTIKLTADPATMRISINCGTASIAGTLLTFLGWPPGTIIKGKDQLAPKMADISRGVHSVFVYVDCIEPTNAGSFQVPLLKEISVGGNNPGDIIFYRQSLPVEAHRLNTQSLSQIKITIKDVHNRVIAFNGFHVGLLLGIRHRQQ